MALSNEISIIAEAWAKLLAHDLKVSVDKALKDGGSKRPQHDIAFDDSVEVSGNGSVKVQILASGDYWDFIDKGVDGTKVKHGSPYAYKHKMIDSEPIEKWIKSSSIDAKRILLDIEIKKKGLSIHKKNLSNTRKELSGKKGYSDAAKRLSRIFAVSIARDGLEPKPYLNSVITQDRIDSLIEQLGDVMEKEIKITFDETLGDFKNIKVNI